ncbi:MAG: FAD-dependent thymidylate synthase [Xenococcaceae cyanobacterium MO_167.B27]|nr:FAD-dependent thymidylate synthase [Xenococcaceae cyanobacterium MO_167.B27]
MDKFRVETIVATPNPQQVVWAAMHQDYSEEFVWDKRDRFPEESKAGELIVKHLLAGNRGHYGCYSADTEVLTKQGWIAWEKVTENHQLLAVDIETKTAHFEKPSSIQKIKFREEDKLYSVKSQYLDLLVTLDHRMVVSDRQKSGDFSEWYFKNASEIYNKPVRYLLSSFLSPEARKIPEDIPQDIDIYTIFKVAGFFFGDGLRTHNKNPASIRFRLRNPRKIAYLLSLDLPTLEMKGDRYVIKNKSLAAWVHENFSTDNGKCIPQWMLTLPENAILAFWDGLKNSDGTRVTKKSWGFNSCEKSAIDLIQATAHINGFSANLTLNNPNVGQKHLNHKPCWRLNISERETQLSQEERNPGIFESLSDYSGYVYCASVSTGALLVRRNGKVIVCGNCLEHPQITFNVGYFPHSMMQQVRTHRVGMCLTGDVEVQFTHSSLSQGEIYYKSTIKELAELWHYGRKHQQTIADANYMKRQISARKIQILDTNTNRVISSHITDIYINGVKEVYEIKTVTGESIKATKNHLFWTNLGWKKVSEFTRETQLCSIVYSGQTTEPSEINWTDEEGKTINNYPYYQVSSLGRVRSYIPRGGKHQPKATTVQAIGKKLSKAKNYLFATFSDYPDRLFLENFRLLDDYSGMEARHINDNSYNNPIANLEWGTFKPNIQDDLVNNVMSSKRGEFVNILSIEYAGFEPTYDLEIEHESHNFIANDLVTHNSFDVQSFRYTGSRIIDVIEHNKDIEDVFYLRPVGNYTNRQGKHYFYSEEQRQQDLQWCLEACKIYQQRISEGLAEEQARSLIPFDARQHFVMSCNARSLMHLLDLRWKKDAQLEAQKFCELLYERFEEWMPNVAHWYLENRAKKARLSP